MLEVGKVVLENGDDIGLCGTWAGEYGTKRGEYRLHLLDRTLLGVLDRSKVDEGSLVLDVGIGVELLKGLLAARVAAEELAGIAGGGALHRRLCLRRRRARPAAEAHVVQHVLDDRIERYHVLLRIQLRIDDIAALSHHAGEQAELAGLDGAHEEAPDAQRTAQRLLLCDAVEPPNRQRTVGEGYIGEAGGLDGEPVGVRHDGLLHKLLGGPHDIDRIGRLVRRDAEEGFRRIVEQEIKELLRHEDVRLAHRLDGEHVAFGAYMLAGREVGDDIERPVRLEEAVEEVAAEVDGLSYVLLGDVVSVARPEFAGKLGERVLVYVYDEHRTWLKAAQGGLDVVGADRACPANHQHPLSINATVHLVGALREIRREQRLRPLGHIPADERFYVEVYHIVSPFLLNPSRGSMNSKILKRYLGRSIGKQQK